MTVTNVPNSGMIDPEMGTNCVVIEEINRDDIRSVPMVTEDFYRSAFPNEIEWDDESGFISRAEMLFDVGALFGVKAVDDGETVCLLVGVIAPDLFTGKTMFTETFFYSRAKKRGIGLKVFKRAEELMLSRGVRKIIMANLVNTSDGDRAGVLYKRLGYTPYEVSWVKEVV